MRIMGLDYGSHTVGVAVTDEYESLALPLKTVFREREDKLRRTISEICGIAASYKVGLVVIGLPLLMSGEEGTRARKTRDFAGKLAARLAIPVVFCDERLTTWEAEELLSEAGRPRARQKEVIDQMAAAIILEDYLRSREGTV